RSKKHHEESIPLRPYGSAHFGAGRPCSTNYSADTREEKSDNSPVVSKREQNIVENRTGGRAAPTTENSSVRTREHLTAAELERVRAAARKPRRYGHRDATMMTCGSCSTTPPGCPTGAAAVRIPSPPAITGVPPSPRGRPHVFGHIPSSLRSFEHRQPRRKAHLKSLPSRGRFCRLFASRIAFAGSNS